MLIFNFFFRGWMLICCLAIALVGGCFDFVHCDASSRMHVLHDDRYIKSLTQTIRNPSVPLVVISATCNASMSVLPTVRAGLWTPIYVVDGASQEMLARGLNCTKVPCMRLLMYGSPTPNKFAGEWNMVELQKFMSRERKPRKKGAILDEGEIEAALTTNTDALSFNLPAIIVCFAPKQNDSDFWRATAVVNEKYSLYQAECSPSLSKLFDIDEGSSSWPLAAVLTATTAPTPAATATLVASQRFGQDVSKLSEEEDELDADAITARLLNYLAKISRPVVYEATEENIGVFSAEGLPFVIVFYDDSCVHLMKRAVELMEVALTRVKVLGMFVILTAHADQHDDQLDRLNLDPFALPMAVFEFSGDSVFPFAELTANALSYEPDEKLIEYLSKCFIRYLKRDPDVYWRTIQGSFMSLPSPYPFSTSSNLLVPLTNSQLPENEYSLLVFITQVCKHSAELLPKIVHVPLIFQRLNPQSRPLVVRVADAGYKKGMAAARYYKISEIPTVILAYQNVISPPYPKHPVTIRRVVQWIQDQSNPSVPELASENEATNLLNILKGYSNVTAAVIGVFQPEQVRERFSYQSAATHFKFKDIATMLFAICTPSSPAMSILFNSVAQSMVPASIAILVPNNRHPDSLSDEPFSIISVPSSYILSPSDLTQFIQKFAVSTLSPLTPCTVKQILSHNLPILIAFVPDNMAGKNAFETMLRQVAVPFAGNIIFTVASASEFTDDQKRLGVNFHQGQSSPAVVIDHLPLKVSFMFPSDMVLSFHSLNSFVSDVLQHRLPPHLTQGPSPVDDLDLIPDLTLASTKKILQISAKHLQRIIDKDLKHSCLFLLVYSSWCKACSQKINEMNKLVVLSETEIANHVIMARIDDNGASLPPWINPNTLPAVMFLNKGSGWSWLVPLMGLGHAVKEYPHTQALHPDMVMKFLRSRCHGETITRSPSQDWVTEEPNWVDALPWTHQSSFEDLYDSVAMLPASVMEESKN